MMNIYPVWGHEYVLHILTVCVGYPGEAGLPGVRGGGSVEEDSSGLGRDVSHQRASRAASGWKLLRLQTCAASHVGQLHL